MVALDPAPIVISGPMINTGGGFTTIVIFVDVPHWPDAGVKVYDVLPVFAVLIEEGFHDPLMPSLDDTGSNGASTFWHNASAMPGNVGVRLVTMLMLTFTGLEQVDPLDGVKV